MEKAGMFLFFQKKKNVFFRSYHSELKKNNFFKKHDFFFRPNPHRNEKREKKVRFFAKNTNFKFFFLRKKIHADLGLFFLFFYF